VGKAPRVVRHRSARLAQRVLEQLLVAAKQRRRQLRVSLRSTGEARRDADASARKPRCNARQPLMRRINAAHAQMAVLYVRWRSAKPKR